MAERSFLRDRPDLREPPQRGGRLGRGRGGARAGKEGAGARRLRGRPECVPGRLQLPRAGPGHRARPPSAGPALLQCRPVSQSHGGSEMRERYLLIPDGVKGAQGFLLSVFYISTQCLGELG